MIGDERAQNVDDVTCEVDQDREQRSELNDGDRGGGLFRLQCLIRAGIKIKQA